MARAGSRRATAWTPRAAGRCTCGASPTSWQRDSAAGAVRTDGTKQLEAAPHGAEPPVGLRLHQPCVGDERVEAPGGVVARSGEAVDELQREEAAAHQWIGWAPPVREVQLAVGQ